MSGRQVVGMRLPRRGERAERAHKELMRQLPDARVGEPDETGTFEIVLEAADHEAALERVWNAIAAAGADEHIVFLEHPDLPEHWRARDAGGP